MPRHTARGIVLHEGRLLLIERRRGGLHYFSIPGGGIEAGETPDQTVLREIAEETGCVVSLERQLYLLKLPDGTEHHIFLCNYQSGVPHLPADSPEALQRDPDNRFNPCWVGISELETTPFMVWQPIAEQLKHDLSTGFAQRVVTLAPGMVP